MSHEATDSAVYPATVTVPDDGDVDNMTTWMAPLQDLINRTAYLKSVPNGGSTVYNNGAELRIVSGGNINVEAGAFLTVLSTGLVSWASGSDAVWSSGATATINSGAILTIASGGYLTVPDGGIISLIGDGASTNYAIVTSAGAGIKIEGAPAAHGTLYMGAYSDADWYNNSTAEFHSGSTATWASGSSFTIASGCDARVGGALKIGDGLGGPGMLTVVGAAGGTGGVIDLSGPDCFALGATATGVIQGVLRRSNAGQITERIITGSIGSASYGPTDADTVITPSLSGAQVYNLPAVAEHGSVMTFVNQDDTDSLTITCSGGFLFLPTPMAGSLVLRDAAGQNWSATVKYSDGVGAHPSAGWYLTSKVVA